MNNIDTNVKKEGIVVIKTLDTLTINSIAKKVAQALCETFTDQKLNYNEIFINLSRTNMYIAKMPKDMSVAKYYYKNSSIYLSDKLNLNNLDQCVIHECIHALQTKTDEKNNIINFGLCNMNKSKTPGMALNEAAVQLIAENCVNSKKENVKYYGLDFSTISPNYYPLQCAILEQVSYIIGKSALIYSTFTGEKYFQNAFSNLTNKKCFDVLQKNLDVIMNLEENILVLNYKLENEIISTKKALKIAKQIANIKSSITDIFIQTQDYILVSYFDNYLNKVQTARDIENLRNKLYNFKNYIGVTENYTFYNDYYLKMMANLEKKYTQLDNAKQKLNFNLPSEYREGTVRIILNKLKKLFKKDIYEDYYYNK